MRILILNWRCPRHPKAGGAEVLTHEVARRLVAAGHQIEWFCASFPGALPEEDIDGVHVIRSGRQWTVHSKAFRRYRGRLRDRFDVVIDEINTMPFFTPLWAGIPTVSLIFQLAREVWWYESKFPLNALGFMLEPWYLRAYRHVPSVTISESTKRDLESLGFTHGITVVPIGIEPVRIDAIAKSATPSFLYVGRLAPSKRIKDIIEAFAIFQREAGFGRLVLIGDGDARYTQGLERLVEMRGLEGSVELLGRVSPGEKERRMKEAHVLLMASVREGWGLVVTEANACGTPAIVYDVPGLRDAVRHGETGLIVQPVPRKMAEAMLSLRNDRERYRRLSAEALNWSQQFSPDTAADAFCTALLRALQWQRIGLSDPNQTGAA